MSIRDEWPWWRWVAIAAGAGIVLAKLALIPRLNINWDEFYFLSLVHAGVRGDLTLVLQGAYTHLFTWLAALDGYEIRQILVARTLCWALFGLSVLMIHRLAARLVSARHAPIAVLAYLAASPVIVHAASFRADALLLPLTLFGMVLLSVPRPTVSRLAVAGIAFGLATAVSIKAALAAPAIALLLLERTCAARDTGQSCWPDAGRGLLLLGAVATATAALLMFAHAMSLPASTPASAHAADAFRKTLLEVPWLPRAAYFWATWDADRVTWWLIFGGAGVALLRRRWAVLACVLSLLPILFYRNAFPYYYVVMLAPASVAVAMLAEWVTSKLEAGGRNQLARFTAAVLVLALLVQGGGALLYLWHDAQHAQRTAVAAVHRIFPEPVPYIDHSGMIASFPKVNFFMSTWGVEEYRRARTGFMDAAIRNFRPPLLIANRPVIDPASPGLHRLLPEDQERIRRSYINYWGPIWVAGTEAIIPSTAGIRIDVPFPGRYRLESEAGLLINGTLVHPEGEVDVRGSQLWVATTPGTLRDSRIRLVWAAARKPPDETPLFGALYRGL